MTYYSDSASNILAGLDPQGLHDLSDHQKRLLVVLLARASEKAYRRGLQHGAEIPARRPLRANLHDWRFCASIDASHCADAPWVERSVDRLFTENPGLAHVGLSADIRGMITIDAAAAARVLVRMVDDHRATLAGADEVPSHDAPTADAIRSFGAEIFAAGGGDLMAEVYDTAWEAGGAQGVAYVSPLWTGIGGWSA